MNKEAITVGDVYTSNEDKNHYMKTIIVLYYTSFGDCYIQSTDGEVVRVTIKYLRHYYHKIGHIDKFAEALKELQKMAGNVER
ncbi:MAG: hypothetical protein IJV31_00720 [Clostridia bacterium]|nr:hypothetical protein [Clostridia bacterium]